MATRFYLSSTMTTATSPNPDAAWQETAAMIRRRATVGYYDGSANTSVTVTSTATSPELHASVQYHSDPLEAQTISGTVTAQMLCSESNAAFNGTLAFGARVISDAGTVRGTLLAVTANTTTSATPPEFATSLTNRQLTGASSSNPLTLTSVVATAGDRIVFEIGVRDADAGTSRTGSVQIGAHSSTTDLPADNTTTTANNPWVEFSGTVTFMALRPPTFTDGVQFQQTAVAIASGPMPSRKPA